VHEVQRHHRYRSSRLSRKFKTIVLHPAWRAWNFVVSIMKPISLLAHDRKRRPKQPKPLF
jgi:hypothetical protein